MTIVTVGATGAITALQSHDANAVAHKVAVGVRVDDGDSTSGGRTNWRESLAHFELDAGRSLDMFATRPYNFGANFPGWQEDWATRTGHTPVVTWSLGYAPGIAKGNKDTVIRARALGLKALGQPVYLRYAPSMDTAGADSIPTAASFVAAWRHTVDVFTAAKANNVRFVWCPSAQSWNAGTQDAWYPGAQYVDVVCADGVVSGATPPSFADTFGGFSQRASAYAKPAWIASFGVQSDDATRAAWLSDAFATLDQQFVNVDAAVLDAAEANALGASARGAFVAGLAANGLSTAAAKKAPTGRLAPASGALLGALLPQVLNTTEQRNWASYEQRSGAPVDIAHTIYPWGREIPTWREGWHISQGRTSMISWGGTSSTAVLNGSQDAYIRKTALALKALNSQIFLRWSWEMDGYFANLAETPAKFVAAWRHVHDVFAAQGATNVVWVWSPTTYGFVNDAAPAYYPGDAYVDWIAADGFDPFAQRGEPSQSFATIYAPVVTWARPHHKPVMAAATGSSEARDPSVKAGWLHDMGRAVQTLYPEIRAVVYFNNPAPMYSDPTLFHWEIESSPTATAAWQALATDPYFRHR